MVRVSYYCWAGALRNASRKELTSWADAADAEAIVDNM
jgi:hypothetical protein